MQVKISNFEQAVRKQVISLTILAVYGDVVVHLAEVVPN
jgi:hypothetical protein